MVLAGGWREQAEPAEHFPDGAAPPRFLLPCRDTLRVEVSSDVGIGGATPCLGFADQGQDGGGMFEGHRGAFAVPFGQSPDSLLLFHQILTVPTLPPQTAYPLRGHNEAEHFAACIAKR
jgi:hypothetical protein